MGYETAAGPENIRKFELRDLRGIIQAAGGVASLAYGGSEAYAMLSAAATPSVTTSYATTVAGRTRDSASTEDSYKAFTSVRPLPDSTNVSASVRPFPVQGAYV